MQRQIIIISFVEMGTSPIFFETNVKMGVDCQMFLKQLAEKLAICPWRKIGDMSYERYER